MTLIGRRLAYCLYLGHHREGLGLRQVCQAALTHEQMGKAT